YIYATFGLCLIGFVVGLFISFKPKLAIEIQKRFYLLINWKIEPVNLIKEIRNTVIMGGFLSAICLMMAIYAFFAVRI
ncbi:MAG: hypothetical protein KKE64_00970, partial [Candidatus Omnitrophica bacterium]|nr:hypothetical protein [Candidatus Omnitrophota bacterium]